jgi:hypothetical protein
VGSVRGKAEGPEVPSLQIKTGAKPIRAVNPLGSEALAATMTNGFDSPIRDDYIRGKVHFFKLGGNRSVKKENIREGDNTRSTKIRSIF